MEAMNPVFVTTCSKNKLGGGSAYPANANTILADTDLMQSCAEFFERLRRGEWQKLRETVAGPDFGDRSVPRGRYRPACDRYARGNFLTSLEGSLGELGSSLKEWLAANRLCFLSGLYGLLHAEEPIQNYDVELSGMAAKHWRKERKLLTRCLIDMLPPNPVVLNCCGETHYSGLIEWARIEGSGVPVYHAIGQCGEDGAQIRAEAGTVAALPDETFLGQVQAGREFYEEGNAIIRFVPTADLPAPAAELPEEETAELDEVVDDTTLPTVGVVDIKGAGCGYDKVQAYVEKRGWTQHFRLIRLSTPDQLKRHLALRGQCIYCCPEPHAVFEGWFGGKCPPRVLTPKKLSELFLNFGRK